ncbi:phytoene/squalene synthase family protein [Halocalculus aciditolerans]|uniref:Geranylgeranyl-diphosphate geranylgeranyltransferase n=1 Tax=Halocalculus aciditolerans TaxID=1383812 RepID=A0A830FFS9_9EURY|nr:phytoene/squalene synthase family protein [Halocalculus aciditolerans]GGL50999.1 geranylgeranyl-diphosphate geranylgeranyltransferase [Halocalculus aciditolerans]
MSSDYAAGKAIQRRTGRTFHLATRFLPERVRHSTYVFYGFVRVVDEVVDAPDRASPAEQRERLDDIRAVVLGDADPDDEVVAAFVRLMEEEGIPDAEVEYFMDAMARDIDTDVYPDFSSLNAYMRGSAVAVGNIMLSIMDPADHAAAAPHAGALARAFQLTNFVRDVREDVDDRERVYLPEETLERHGSGVEEVRSRRVTPEFRAAVREELERAEEFYREGVRGIPHLPADCQFAVLVSAVLYAEVHRDIRARDYDTLSARPDLSTLRKLGVVAKTWVAWRRTGQDPVATFERVSAVPST